MVVLPLPLPYDPPPPVAVAVEAVAAADLAGGEAAPFSGAAGGEPKRAGR